MNYHRASLLFAGIVCAISSAGCNGTTSSSTLPTGNIAAFIEVSDDGYGSLYVDVDLRVRSRTGNDDNYVQLAKGDSLQAALGGETASLTEYGSGHYQTAFSPSNAAELTIAFDRSKYDDATATGAILPEAVAIAGLEGTILSRDYDGIVLDLPETGADKSIDVEGACIDSLHYDIGTYDEVIFIDPGDLYAPVLDAECDVTVTITTTSLGAVDPALHPDSTFVLSRSRSTTFYSIP